MFSAATEGDVELVDYHVSRGVDVNYVHPEILGTALVASIMAEREQVALYLLDHGADPNSVSDFEGLTPLQAARRAGLSAVATKLLAMGVEESAVDPATAGWGTVASARDETHAAKSGSWLSRFWKRLG